MEIGEVYCPEHKLNEERIEIGKVQLPRGDWEFRIYMRNGLVVQNWHTYIIYLDLGYTQAPIVVDGRW